MTCTEESKLKEAMPRRLEYQRLFDSFDIEKSGFIKIQAVRDFFRMIGLDIDIEVPKSSRNGNEKIDFEAVLEMVNTLNGEDLSDKDLMHCIFKEIDHDADGYISANDLRSLLSRFGQNISEHKLQEMMSEADTDGDGKVSFNEFIEITSYPDSCADLGMNHQTDTETIITALCDNSFSAQGDLASSTKGSNGISRTKNKGKKPISSKHSLDPECCGLTLELRPDLKES